MDINPFLFYASSRSTIFAKTVQNMDRKQFISGTTAIGALFSINSPISAYSITKEFSKVKIPCFLKPGDIIGITSPASHITVLEIEPAVAKLTEWGFRVKIGQSIGKQYFTLGGTDEERINDLQMMLDDPTIGAIMCARGGYGIVRIIDKLNFDRFKESPKWIIGFSDITVLHCHINEVYNIASIHSKMCNSFPIDWERADEIQKNAILSIKDALLGIPLFYETAQNNFNRFGSAKGVLVGGNLSIIESLSGSISDLNTDGKMLFLEDTGEYLYNIDRMFWNLQRSGKLRNLRGLIIGGFNIKPDDEGEEFGKTIYEIVLEKVAEYKYPVLFDFQVGHQINNVALNCGLMHQLVVSAKGASLSVQRH